MEREAARARNKERKRTKLQEAERSSERKRRQNTCVSEKSCITAAVWETEVTEARPDHHEEARGRTEPLKSRSTAHWEEQVPGLVTAYSSS